MARRRLVIAAATTFAALTHSANSSAVDCFIDSVNGSDANNGLSEDQAVKTQTMIPSSCTAAKFRRGSDFNQAVAVRSSIKTYTNYGSLCDPLPKFHVARSPNNGSMFNGMMGSGYTIDGLYLSGSMSDASMSNLLNGVCVVLGSNNKLVNSELTNCDIGIMLFGENNLVQGNYVHDLYISVDAAPGVDPNDVGGAEGIFVDASNNEVSYNSFIRCSSTAQWTGGSCDGGATEVSVGAGKTLSGVKIHHNLSYLSCGFFEAASIAGTGKGTFADSEFYDNVSIDSGWLMLLQVNNTNFSNIRWTNNTIVQHASQSVNPGMLVTIFNGTSSGQTGGSLAPNSVFLVNDLFILDGFGTGSYVSPLDANLVQDKTLIVRSPGTNSGVVNVAGTTAADFDLVAGSPAIDAGTSTPYAVDYLNRSVPSGTAMDVGAFEYGASLATGYTTPVPADVAVRGCGTGGTSTGGSGGTTSTGGSGGTTSTGGASAGGSGGSTSAGSGGSAITAGAAGSTATAGGSSATGGSGGSTGWPAGGTTNAPSGTGGSSTNAGDSGSPSGSDQSGSCACTAAGVASSSTRALWVTLLVIGCGVARTRRRERITVRVRPA